MKKGGWHVNDEAPISGPGAHPRHPGSRSRRRSSPEVDLAASTKESARFDIPVSATEAGKKTIAAEARFVLCQQEACKPVKETLTLAIEVTPPAVAAKKKKN